MRSRLLALDAVGRGSGRLLSHRRHTPGAAAVARGWGERPGGAVVAGDRAGWRRPWARRRSPVSAPLRRWATPPTAPPHAPRVPRSPGAAPRGGAAREPGAPWGSP